MAVFLWSGAGFLSAQPAATAGVAGEVAEEMTGEVIGKVTSEPRFISLAPHITEILFAVGAGSQVVGAVSFSDYPPEAEQIPRIGSSDRFSYETIVNLQPTLVFGWKSGNGQDNLQQIEKLGIPVYAHEPRTLEDVADSLETFGKLAGREAQGQQQASLFRTRLENLRQTYSDKAPVSVYYQLWNEPQMTVNDEHLISDVIRLCGGANIFADAIPLIPKISVEVVIQRKPEVIVATGMAEERPAWLDDWRKWSSLPAVSREQLFHIHPDLLHRHSPRILDGAEILCEQLDSAR